MLFIKNIMHNILNLDLTALEVTLFNLSVSRPSYIVPVIVIVVSIEYNIVAKYIKYLLYNPFNKWYILIITV